jgi:hypothetical protein
MVRRSMVRGFDSYRTGTRVKIGDREFVRLNKGWQEENFIPNNVSTRTSVSMKRIESFARTPHKVVR